MAQPQKRAALAGLVLAGEFDRIVRDRRAEIGAPFGFAVVAVGAGIGQHIDTRVPDLNGQRVGVGVRGDGKEPMGPAVAAAPNLGGVGAGRSKNRNASIREAGWAPVRPPRHRPRSPG